MHIQPNPFGFSPSPYAAQQTTLQWLQFLPQQLQQLQQLAHVQQQQLQQIQQLIQLVPHQVQQVLQQLVAQQQFGGAQPGIGAGIVQPTPGLGVPFQPVAPYGIPSGLVM